MMEFENTVILSSCHVTQLFETEKSRALDYVNISEMNFIAGAYNVDNNHWLALIIDVNKDEFILLDPMNKSTPRLDKCFKSWCNYYHSRKNKHDASWKIRKIDHPLQKDHYNCGVFVIQFIKHYLSCRVENDKINFDCSPTSLECDRLLISSAIENYKKN